MAASVNAAVLRVKRRFDDEPLDALVLACKRRKKEDSPCTEEDNPFTTILKFAGTVKNQDENVAQRISSFRKDVKSLTHSVDLSAKLREKSKKLSQESRYKVVNFFRTLDQDKPEPDDEPVESHVKKCEDWKNVMILDIEDSTTPEHKGEASEGYVYDLYYTGEGSDNWDDALLDQMVSVRPLPNDLVFNNDNEDSDHPEDDPDSNDENNERNEYPDTDESMDDEMQLANELGEFHIGSAELSSDEADEEYLRYEDADPVDIARYGQGYARYKARINKELYNEVASSSDDESS